MVSGSGSRCGLMAINPDDPPTYARLTADYAPVGLLFPKGKIVKIIRRAGYADKHYRFEVEVVTQAVQTMEGFVPPERKHTLLVTSDKLQPLSALEQLASAAEGLDDSTRRNSLGNQARR